jgi:hypothetical protein
MPNLDEICLLVLKIKYAERRNLTVRSFSEFMQGARNMEKNYNK